MIRFALAAVLAFSLAGCPFAVKPPAPSLENAEALLHQGDAAGAARMFLALAQQNTGAARADYQLRASAAWLRAGLTDSAEEALTGIDANLPPTLAEERAFMQVDIDLARGQGSQAWTRLAGRRAPSSAPQAIRYLELRERAALATGRAVDAIRAELDREQWIPGTPGRLEIRAQLLHELRDAGEHGTKLEREASKDEVIRGWLELGSIAAAAVRNPALEAPQIESWRARYPGHPASEIVRSELLGREPPRPPGGGGGQIALLLPLSGNLGSAASQVRDGFYAAYNRLPEAARPTIHVYDTATMKVSEAIAQAAADGAGFIVGPLARDELSAAADYSGARPPLLALNFLPAERAAPPNFYQFALSPEDEARQVARRVLAEGERRGIALVTGGSWGERVLAAFNEELTAGGGRLIAQEVLDPGKADFSLPISEALRLTDSKARHRRLESVLGTKLAFEPRRRADVDFIFAAAQPAMARLLRPQLKFFYAGDIPTYGVSDSYDPNPQANQDLDGLLFPEMPWMLGTGTLAQEVRDASKDAAPNAGQRRGRLFAFGFDAYNLVGALRAPTPLHLDGLTGLLTLGPDRRVKRELAWAQIKGGEAELLQAAGESSGE